MSDTTAVLNYHFKRTSTLDRREFLVDLSVWTNDGAETAVQYSVTAPDRLEASRMVRRDLDGKATVTCFRMEMVREVAPRYVSSGSFPRQVPAVVNVWDSNL